MKIPSSFELGGRTWTVVQKPNKKLNVLGRCYAGRCCIELYKARSDDELMHTFLHELVHAISYTLGNKKRFNDEYFTDSVSGMLLQFVKTAK